MQTFPSIGSTYGQLTEHHEKKVRGMTSNLTAILLFSQIIDSFCAYFSITLVSRDKCDTNFNTFLILTWTSNNGEAQAL